MKLPTNIFEEERGGTVTLLPTNNSPVINLFCLDLFVSSLYFKPSANIPGSLSQEFVTRVK